MLTWRNYPGIVAKGRAAARSGEHIAEGSILYSDPVKEFAWRKGWLQETAQTVRATLPRPNCQHGNQSFHPGCRHDPSL